MKKMNRACRTQRNPTKHDGSSLLSMRAFRLAHQVHEGMMVGLRIIVTALATTFIAISNFYHFQFVPPVVSRCQFEMIGIFSTATHKIGADYRRLTVDRPPPGS
ncbi:hypothetical protein Pan97_41510 [Bremerella volcania]|uniref:Uncharacterized protein n=1 Tax=Bremerella volcania TaxID=2527984 RepID=A0A518CCZ5_9BACT|nr:hypothetical protein Pan97_41510 [Bremerella volcania]